MQGETTTWYAGGTRRLPIAEMPAMVASNFRALLFAIVYRRGLNLDGTVNDELEGIVGEKLSADLPKCGPRCRMAAEVTGLEVGSADRRQFNPGTLTLSCARVECPDPDWRARENDICGNNQLQAFEEFAWWPGRVLNRVSDNRREQEDTARRLEQLRQQLDGLL